MQYNAKDLEIDFAQAYVVMTCSQTKLSQQQEDAENKLDVPQMPTPIVEKGIPLPYLPNDPSKKSSKYWLNYSCVYYFKGQYT